MKYLFKNYKCFAKYDTSLYVLAIISIITSTLIIHFSYGLYQNYHIIWNGDRDVITEQNEISFTFTDNDSQKVTKGEFAQCIKQISQEMDTIQASGNSDFVLLDIYAPLKWNYPEEQDFDLKVFVDRDGLKAPGLVFDNMMSYDFSDGSRWSDTEEQDGDRIAIFWDYKEMNIQEYANPECAINDDNTVTIENNKYQIIGYQSFMLTPMIPYSSLDDNVTFHSGTFTFTECVSETTFETITGILKKQFGDRITILDENKNVSKDAYYVYNTVFIIVVLLAFVAVLDIMILYRYYLKKQKYAMCIFRICGMSRWKAIWLQLLSCILLSVPVYIISALVFAYGMLPALKPYFVYMKNAFNWKIYISIFFIYIVYSLFIGFIIIWKENSRKIVPIINS